MFKLHCLPMAHVLSHLNEQLAKDSPACERSEFEHQLDYEMSSVTLR